jgi:hypothetical protein
LQGRQQIAKVSEGTNCDQWGTQREVDALRAKHPGWERTNGLVGQLAEDVFAMTILHAFDYAQRLPKKRMPAIVDGGGLRMMGIM